MRSSQGGGGSSETGHRIRVVVRLRPTAATKTIHVDQAACTLTIPNSRGEALMSSSAQETRSVVDHTAEGLRFGVDRIYESSATQSDVFEHEAAPLSCKRYSSTQCCKEASLLLDGAVQRAWMSRAAVGCLERRVSSANEHEATRPSRKRYSSTQCCKGTRSQLDGAV